MNYQLMLTTTPDDTERLWPGTDDHLLVTSESTVTATGFDPGEELCVAIVTLDDGGGMSATPEPRGCTVDP